MKGLIFVILLPLFFSTNAYGNNCARLTNREFYVESLSNSCHVVWGAQILNIGEKPIEVESESALVNKKGCVLHKDRSRKIFLGTWRECKGIPKSCDQVWLITRGQGPQLFDNCRNT